MDAERISSRKNKYIAHLRALASDADYRYACAEYLCDGMKLLAEALDKGARVQSVLWKDAAEELLGLDGAKQYIAPAELFDYASPMKNSPGPVFTLAMPEGQGTEMRRAVLLENVQDPGNVGTVLRTLDAFDADGLFLLPGCADVYSPKTMRASMGAVFRRPVWTCTGQELHTLLRRSGIPLYGAALRADTMDARAVELSRAAVAIGSEGRGLTEELLALCDGTVRIPMSPRCESLNAAVAASVLLWEAYRGEEMDACQH